MVRYNPFTGRPFVGQSSSDKPTSNGYSDPVLHEPNYETGTWYSYDSNKGWTDTKRPFNKPNGGGSRSRRTVHRKRKSHRKSKRVHQTRRKHTRRHRHSRRQQ